MCFKILFTFFSSSFYQAASCASNNIVYARGVTNNECEVLDDDYSARYSFPYLNYYDTTEECDDTPSLTVNVEADYPCVLVGPEGAGDEVDVSITGNSYMKFNLVRNYPTNPVYAVVQVFDEGCGTALTAVDGILTGVCFSDGITSQKFTCSKFILLLYFC
jgi:hypothetical protein